MTAVAEAERHTCTEEECGWTCWLEDGEPTKNITVHYGDAGDIDAEGPCFCEEHE